MEKEPLEDQELAQSLVGHVITRVLWFDSAPNDEWTGHDTAWIWLDDGRVIEFGAWGHDAWGATMSEVRVIDVEQCLHCGKPHLDARICEGWEYSGRLPTTPFAWCSDGHNCAMKVAAMREP